MTDRRPHAQPELSPELPGEDNATRTDDGRRNALAQAAETALLPWDGAPPALGRVEAATFDVMVGGERAVVALRLDGGRLSHVCTCLERDCDHARVALEALATARPAQTSSSTSYPALRAAAVSTLPPAVTPAPPAEDAAALAEALDDVMTSVVRSGVAAKDAPAVREAVDRLRQAAPDPIPMGLDRFLGRLRLALADDDLHTVARVLVGAADLAEAIRQTAEQPSPRAQARVESWLSAGVGQRLTADPISDRVMMEVGREVLDGADRASIDRRYFIDLDSGDVFHEDKRAGGTGASLGPCPRVVQVGLAAVGRASPPRRIRLLQYTSLPVVTDAHYGQLLTVVLRSFGVLVEHVRAAVQDDPGLAEPFAVVAPHAVGGAALSLLDESGHALPLTGGQEPAVLAFLSSLFEQATPAFVAGRLVDRGGALMLRPVSLGFPDGTGIRHVRV